MQTFVAKIAVGPDRTNTYDAEFQADDIDHAREQAEDHVRTTAVEWVVAVTER